MNLVNRITYCFDIICSMDQKAGFLGGPVNKIIYTEPS